MTRMRASAFLLLLCACDGAAPIDGGPADSGRDGGVDLCEGFVVPDRIDVSRCDEVDPSSPGALAICALGSGHAGRWAIDDDGLPAYDFSIDQRCDPAGAAYSPRPYPLRDPIHLVGNGRGLVAMAHASGGVEIYTQDRGHAWLNRIDTWRDPRDPDYPPQLGGGFSYIVVGGEVRSTRFEDLPVAVALERQSRRFGVGYFETITRFADLIVRRRVFAPESDARALVAEIEIENTTGAAIDVGLVELWDVNLHQIDVELATSDLLGEALEVTANIDRRRRRFADVFTHEVRWDAAARTAHVATSSAPPAEIADRLTPSEQDYFPNPIYLAALDGEPDAAWLLASELWTGTDRSPPNALASTGSADTRVVEAMGQGQPVALALRVPIEVPANGSAVRRFAFGYTPAGAKEEAAIAELRASAETSSSGAIEAWRDRMIWAAFEGVSHAGALHRELAWSSYYAIANATFDEYHGVRLAGQGGAYKYVHGLDGAIGDLALFADAIAWIDPALARDTLVYTMSIQASSTHPSGAWRFPYATTGVGSHSDVGIYTQRSDAYWLVPSSVARYVALTRDDAFLDREIPFHPHAEGEAGSVVDHARRALEYAEETLGYGARGIVAMGTNDYADGILRLSPEETTPTGSSSTFNALFIAMGFPLASDIFASRDAELGARMRSIADSQITLLESDAWNGEYYERGFADNGNPLTPTYLFVEPQVLPILAGLVDDDRRDVLLDLVRESFETPLGAMTTIAIGDGGGGTDQPQIGGVWPVASAWVTDAWSRRDPARGWDSFVRNTLFTHGTLHPDLWYGIWTGPDSYNGPDHERAGEADAHVATALTDYPALNAHVHVGPIRALLAVLGVEANARGLTIAPRVPTERFNVRLPRLWLDHSADRFAGRVFTSVDATIEMRVRIPTALREAELRVTADGAESDFAVEGDDVVFAVPARDAGTDWEIAAR
jgi:hypothetical protein